MSKNAQKQMRAKRLRRDQFSRLPLGTPLHFIFAGIAPASTPLMDHLFSQPPLIYVDQKHRVFHISDAADFTKWEWPGPPSNGSTKALSPRALPPTAELP